MALQAMDAVQDQYSGFGFSVSSVVEFWHQLQTDSDTLTFVATFTKLHGESSSAR